VRGARGERQEAQEASKPGGAAVAARVSRGCWALGAGRWACLSVRVTWAARPKPIEHGYLARLAQSPPIPRLVNQPARHPIFSFHKFCACAGHLTRPTRFCVLETGHGTRRWRGPRLQQGRARRGERTAIASSTGRVRVFVSSFVLARAPRRGRRAKERQHYQQMCQAGVVVAAVVVVAAAAAANERTSSSDRPDAAQGPRSCDLSTHQPSRPGGQGFLPGLTCMCAAGCCAQPAALCCLSPAPLICPSCVSVVVVVVVVRCLLCPAAAGRQYAAKTTH
jgi:hypothetical protein